MSEMQPLSDSIQRLSSAGDPRKLRDWADRDPDYVRQYGLTPADVPQLIDLARRWAEEFEWPGDETGFAPVHAWRALGQLGAVEATEPLVGMMNALDAMNDDWHCSDFRHVFGMIGPTAIGPLEEFLSEPANRLFPRLHASGGLTEIAKRHPSSRHAVVQALTRQLEKREPNVYELNAEIIGGLLELQAVESAEAIERAFSAGVVDEGYVGDWQTVKEELGVDGLGLPQPQNPYNSVLELRQSWQQAEREASRQVSNEERRKKNEDRHKKLAAKLREKRKRRKKK
jgi:hypothetical protein